MIRVAGVAADSSAFEKVGPGNRGSPTELLLTLDVPESESCPDPRGWSAAQVDRLPSAIFGADAGQRSSRVCERH